MQDFLEIPSALRIDRMTLTDQDEPIEVLAAPVCRCGDQWEHYVTMHQLWDEWTCSSA